MCWTTVCQLKRTPSSVARSMSSLMEDGTAHSKAGGGGEFGLGDDRAAGAIGGEEADAGEGSAGGGFEIDAEVSEGGDGVGHEAFAAGFVDGRGHAVGDFDGEAQLSGGDGAGEAGGTTAGDEDVGGVRVRRSCRKDLYHLSKTSSEQNAGPMAARMLYVPGSPGWMVR